MELLGRTGILLSRTEAWGGDFRQEFWHLFDLVKIEVRTKRLLGLRELLGETEQGFGTERALGWTEELLELVKL